MSMIVLQQPPVRNASVVGSQVYSHSGEFSPRVVDVVVPGRALSFQFVRKYRSSRCNELGPLGRGWTFVYNQRIAQENKDIVYSDGLGRAHRFTRRSGKGDFQSPDGFYALLADGPEEFLLKYRYGAIARFDHPENGGRLRSIENENGNILSFKYSATALRVTDALRREMDIVLERGRVVKLQDHAGRSWRYNYDAEGCLIEIVQPPTDDFPSGTSVSYAYDASHRLVSITDPKGQTFLRNFYDDQGRVFRQLHGMGKFEFGYETIGKTKAGFPVYRTEVSQKNNSKLLLEHDGDGHVITRTLFVKSASLSAEDRGGARGEDVGLTTKSRFNRHGELIERVNPSGDNAEWLYDDMNVDPRPRGNLMQVTRKPASGIASGQTQIVTRFTHERRFNRRTSITGPRGHTVTFKWDDRGNLVEKIYPKVTIQTVQADKSGAHPVRTEQLSEKFEYNPSGQLVGVIDCTGAVTRYFYYPEDDITGASGRERPHSDAGRAGGYLARIVRDPESPDRTLRGKPAHLVTELGYDAYGNISLIRDGKGKAMRFAHDSRNRVTAIASRSSPDRQILIRYDANGNAREVRRSFRYQTYDREKGGVEQKSATISRRFDYNILNHVIRRSSVYGEDEIIESFVRDANENIVRKIQPMGSVSEFRYDERNLLLERRLAAGTGQETTIGHTYTPNGRRRSVRDGMGQSTRYHYDGFHRYVGFTNAGGTTKRQSFDEVGNITRIEINGDPGQIDDGGKARKSSEARLLETRYRYDELNRRTRVDRACWNVDTGAPLGEGGWDGEPGVSSTVIEYGGNHWPSKVWYETGNILSFEYDGANRVIAASDATGNSLSLAYDENGNPVRFDRLGPGLEGDRDRFKWMVFQEFDDVDRLVKRSVNSEPPESFAYNELGQVIEYENPAGAKTFFLYDAWARPAGRAAVAVRPGPNGGRPTGQTLLRRVERDRNNRVIARVNSIGARTHYTYDGRNRRASVVYPDGTTKHFERDANGNVVRIVDQNRNVIVHKFDSLNRLTERRVQMAMGGEPQVERFHYDGLNRLVGAISGGSRITRRYDSLSHLLEEQQGDRKVRYGYDSAGNRVLIRYPGRREVSKEYDALRRVTSIRDDAKGLIARYTYRSNGQLRSQEIGNLLEADFAYDARRGLLKEIVYRSTKDKTFSEGSRYQFDVVGNRTQEVQLHRGEKFGEEYFYDSANRLIRVRYGVKDLDDPRSEFDHEVDYDLAPGGTWQHRTMRAPDGRVLERVSGATNARQAYVTLGARRFEYDANGNRIVETDDANATKRWSCDYANRPVKVEFLGRDGRVQRAIDYTYDVFGRQVARRVTDADGERHLLRVWNGRQLIEEWQDGRLSRSFVFGARVDEPIVLTRHSGEGEERFVYTFDGRGFVTGLVDSRGSSVERYGYDAFRQPFLSERDGRPVEGQVSSSPLGNPFFVAGSIWDGDTNSFRTLGNSYEPGIGQYQNPESLLGEPGCANAYAGGTNPATVPVPPRVAGAAEDQAETGAVTALTGGLIVLGAGFAAPALPLAATLVIAGAGLGVLGAGLFDLVEGLLADPIVLDPATGRPVTSSGPDCGPDAGGSADSQSLANDAEEMDGMMGGGMGGDDGGMMGGGGMGGDGGGMGGDGGMMGGGMGGDDGGMMGGGMGGGMGGDGGMGEGGTMGGQDPGAGSEGEKGSGGMGGGCGGGDGGAGMGGGAADYSAGDDPGLDEPSRGGGATDGVTQPGGGMFGIGNAGPIGPSGGCGGDGSPGGTGADGGFGGNPLSSDGGCSGGSGNGAPGGECGGGFGPGYGPVVGGTNPVALAADGAPRVNPSPIDSAGVMGAPGGATIAGLPGGGLTDPAGEDIGMGGGFGGSYPPVQSGQPYTDPSPEQSGATCGGGAGGIRSSPADCSPF